MASLIDLYNGLLRYNNQDIVIVIDSDLTIWFYAKQIASILEYKETRKIIKRLDVDHKKQYADLKDYSKYRYNIQDHAIFINEHGLYELTFKSKMKEAEKFRKWISTKVMPTLRKTGVFSLNKSEKKELDTLNEKLNEYKKRIKVLEHNQKKEKYPEGGYIYIIQPANIDKLFKVGKTDKLSKRLNTYNTTVPDKVNVIYKLKVKSPIAVEHCVKGFLYEYRYSNNKEYYKIGLRHIKKVIKSCDKMLNNKKAMKREIININESETEGEDIYGILAVPKESKQKGGNMINTFDIYFRNKSLYIALNKR